MAATLPNIVETSSLIGMSIGMLVGGAACAAATFGLGPVGVMVSVLPCMAVGGVVGAVVGAMRN